MKESQKELIRSITKLKRFDVYGGRDGCTDVEESSDGTYVLHDDLKELTDKLKQEFPEAFEAKLEVGKWYHYNSCLINYCGRNGHLLTGYGIGVDSNWITKGNMGSSPDEWVEATKEEVEAALIKEAKIRDVWNAPIKCLETKVDLGHCPAIETNFSIKYNKLESPRGTVFKDGEWAEPLHKELTLAQIEKELGYKVKIVKE